MRGEQKQEHAGESGGNREKNDEGVLPGSELSDENQVNENNRQNEADAETAEGRAHALHGAAKIDADAFRELGFFDAVVDLTGDRAEVFGFRGNVNVHDAEQLIVIHFRWRRNGLYFHDAVEEGRLGAFYAAQRNLLEVGDGFDGIFGILHGQHVGIAALGIDPIIRSNHAVGSERGDDIVHDFLLGEAQEAGFFAVHVEFERRVIDVLRNEHVIHIFELAHGLGEVRGGVVNLVEIVAANLNINGCRQAEIDYGVHQATGLKVSAELRELFA